MRYLCCDFYKDIDSPEEWLECPNCGLKPKVWIFDNGRSTACGCGKSKYDHFSIHAESFMSVAKRSDNGACCKEYNSKELQHNWNHWVETGEILFKHASKRNDDKW